MADTGTDGGFRRAAARLLDGGRIDGAGPRRPFDAGEALALRIFSAISTGGESIGNSPAPRSIGGKGRARDPAPLATGFEILEEIGRGRSARVYRARDRALDREVALKVLDVRGALADFSRERFVEEARALASVDHRNVVRIHAIDEERGSVRLCLELVRGRTLDRIVREEGVFAPRSAARVAGEICRALGAVHVRGLVHRDVKPANVMIADEGRRVVLLDFGIARAADGELSAASLRDGTPLFMSPERLLGRPSATPGDDLFSLGVLMHFLVSSEYPFAAPTVEGLRARILRSPASRLSGVDAAYSAIVRRLLAPREKERYPTAAAAARAIQAFLRESGVTGRRRAPSRRPRRR